MEVMIEHLGDVQFEVRARGHRLYCDQPLNAGGFDEGMTPPEFLLAALGTCAGYYAAEYLRANRLPAQGLRVRTVADKVKGPARLDHFEIEIDYPAELSEAHRQGVLASVNKCLIHNTLTHPPEITVELARSSDAPRRGLSTGEASVKPSDAAPVPSH
jgi:putative redox protein